MKLATALLSCALFATPMTANAEDKHFPEEFLMNSLSKISVCVTAETIAIDKLAFISKEMQTEESGDTMLEDHKKTLNQILSSITGLQDIIFIQKLVGRHMAAKLITEHNHTAEDLNKSLNRIVEKTNDNMKDLFKNVQAFNEFVQVFTPKMNICNEAMEDIITNGEKYDGSIESKK